MKYLGLRKIVLIGASTGGPGQIQKIIESLPKLQNTTIVIAQHMIDGFMDSFAARFKSISCNKISVVQDNEVLENAKIYICDGEIRLVNKNFTKKKSSLNTYNPNINILFNSFTQILKDTEMLCVILTGIGDDGVEACSTLSINGARCITENAQSAIVDGMPSRARLLVPNIEAYDINEITQIISEFCE